MKFNPKYCFEYIDQFNLCNTIKQINPNYKLYFNTLTKEYIIINTAKNNHICLNFNNFNLNVENILKSTSVEHSHKLFKELDDFNLNLENKLNLNKTNKTKELLKQMDYFSKRTNSFNIKNLSKYTEEF